jgi:hypothetical protein
MSKGADIMKRSVPLMTIAMQTGFQCFPSRKPRSKRELSLHARPAKPPATWRLMMARTRLRTL